MKIDINKKLFRLFLILLLFATLGCQRESSHFTQFELLTGETTGITFINDPKQSPELNVFNFMYFYNGGGVSVGDFNNDGLQDIYFTSNLGDNKLFLNKGNLWFEDVTVMAKVSGIAGWNCGSTIVDINNDGLLDIYVSQIGDYEILQGKNQLYVCQSIKDGIPIYEDKAKEYNLDLIGFSTQAAFFDYDLDGDLDMFQLNHSLHQNNTFGKRDSFLNKRHELSGDKLLRNDDGVFNDVSEEANILSIVIGYGLGIAISDINLDGWPDIYIGNDFHENDYLYINQQDGTFKESIVDQMRHTSRFTMGVDIADINNDGYTDVFSLDMAPDDPYILKTSLGEDGYNVFKYKLRIGYNHQYARNNLQLNNGDDTFREIGLYAGVDATDWSWSPLLFDFDHDGYKDLFISNGIPKRMNDIDYVNFMTSTNEKLNNPSYNDDMAAVEMMPEIKLPNRFFINKGNLHFKDVTEETKNGMTSFSNGSAYSDFDNDGDLDLIVNNMYDKPFLYKNNQVENGSVKSDYIYINLTGSKDNLMAVGAKIMAIKNGDILIAENFPTKGYQSNVQNGLHLGLGDATLVDSLLLIWPDNSYERINKSNINNVIAKSWKTGLPYFNYNEIQKKSSNNEFLDITGTTNIDFIHQENQFAEFNREALLPEMVSTEGPAIVTGDLNGDGLDDLFIGGAKRRRSEIYTQLDNGSFVKSTPDVISNDSLFEDIDAIFVDVENDGDLDIVVASGGNEYRGESEYRKQRLYVNDGTGQYTKQYPFEGAFMTASCVLAADYNNDGLVDLFFGGRAQPYMYGVVPPSYLFENTGNGKFMNVTDDIASSLGQAGMVKNGDWIDIDQDGDLDLVLAVEWQPIKIYLNKDGKFVEQPINDITGWWNFVLPYDFDHDGDIDILAGNTGENSKFKPTKEEPLRLYVADFDDNKQVEQILTYYKKGKEIPFATYQELTTQLPSLKKQFLYAKDFAKASLYDLFGKEKIDNSIKYEAVSLSNTYFENLGEGLSFKAHKLPWELQLSTLETASILRVNQGSTDLIIGGNFYDCNIEMGRYDANFGNILTISTNGGLSSKPLGKLKVYGQVRKIKKMKIKEKNVFVLGINDAPVRVISEN